MLDFGPPSPSQLPALPSPPRTPIWKSDGWIFSTHVFPAAHLRLSVDLALPSIPNYADTNSAHLRQNITHRAEARLRDLRRLENLKPFSTQPKTLWISINRYVNKHSLEDGLTLLFAHANGFNKETWEPTLEHLIHSAHISEMWVLESVQTGDSALLNAGKLDSLFHWTDASRDVLDFLVYFLPSSTSPSLPVHLPQLSTRESEFRLDKGFSGRRLIAVGHSFGGCVCTLAALAYPSLFTALVLVDPVIIRPPSFSKPPREFGILRNDHARTVTSPRNPLTLGALSRRNAWNSREEIWNQFSRSPFFSAWHPAVLQMYIEYGTYKCEDSVYRLKTDPLHEAVVFSDTSTGSEDAWTHLRDLDENIEIRWIMPGEGKPQLGGTGAARETVHLRPKNSSNVRIPGVGHLIPQEAPAALAEEILELVARKYTQIRSRL